MRGKLSGILFGGKRREGFLRKIWGRDFVLMLDLRNGLKGIGGKVMGMGLVGIMG